MPTPRMGAVGYKPPPPSSAGPWFDELVGDWVSVHIERMDENHIWMRIGDRTFRIFGTNCKAARVNIQEET